MNRLYYNDYKASNVCNGCYEGPAKHHWPLDKKPKYIKPFTMKVLSSLYGSRSNLLKDGPKGKRPASAMH